jgi:hypothetical protein
MFVFFLVVKVRRAFILYLRQKTFLRGGKQKIGKNKSEPTPMKKEKSPSKARALTALCAVFCQPKLGKSSVVFFHLKIKSEPLRWLAFRRSSLNFSTGSSL